MRVCASSAQHSAVGNCKKWLEIRQQSGKKHSTQTSDQAAATFAASAVGHVIQ